MIDVEKYLAQVRSIPQIGVTLYQTLRAFQTQQQNLAQQTNANLNGEPAAPPPLAGITVTSTSAGHHISLTHPGEFYRGVEYHAFYSENKHFTNPFPVYMGPSREHDVATGGKALYFGAFAQYPTGQPGPVVYHGGATPIAVTGGVDAPLGTSQGSGTGLPGVAQSGHGPVAFRSASGAPPVRGTSANAAS
jgi:hypothetical protein